MSFTLDAAFFVALLKIIGINIILSGDNAVVIALACRSLPERQRKRGIILGAGAAVVLRVLFTVFVTGLMAIPFLKLGGGLLLLWVGYKLMVEEETSEDDIKASSNLFGAVRTILVADAVMSLDNVLAVAAAAQGSLPLLITGVLLSIPLVVYGATLMMALIHRFPFIITLGAALIGYVGGEVIVSDPAVEPWLHQHAPWTHTLLPLLCAALVVDCGAFFAPSREHAAAKGGGGSVSATINRFLAAMFGALALARVPLAVSLAVGVVGYMAARYLMPFSPTGDSGQDLIQRIGPWSGVVLALALAELVARTAMPRARAQG